MGDWSQSIAFLKFAKKNKKQQNLKTVLSGALISTQIIIWQQK